MAISVSFARFADVLCCLITVLIKLIHHRVKRAVSETANTHTGWSYERFGCHVRIPSQKSFESPAREQPSDGAHHCPQVPLNFSHLNSLVISVLASNSIEFMMLANCCVLCWAFVQYCYPFCPAYVRPNSGSLILDKSRIFTVSLLRALFHHRWF